MRNKFGWTACWGAVMLCVCQICHAQDAIDRYVAHEMRTQHIPGLSLAIVKSGRIVKAKGYGIENIEQGSAATPQTVYRLASLSKQFTASAIMLLVQDGRIGLDDKISQYLNPVPAAWADITVRELLTHTSGIKDYINDLHLLTVNGTTEAELVKVVGKEPLNFKPGSAELYCNTNYLVLGLIVRNVSGLSYDQFLNKRVFAPLGMSETEKLDYAKIVPHRAGEYELVDGGLHNAPYLQPTIYGNGDAGVFSSVVDLARWDAALVTGKILTKASEDAMYTSARLPDGSSAHYGLGWKADFGEPRFVSHDGSLPGTATYIVRYLDQEVTVIVLANLSGAPASQIARHVAGLYDPTLALHHASPDAKEKPAVSAKMKSLIEGIQDGSPDPKLFTSEEWTHGGMEQMVPRLRDMFRVLGTFRTVSFLSGNQQGDKQQYFYWATFSDGDQLLDFTLDQDGRIIAMGLDAV